MLESLRINKRTLLKSALGLGGLTAVGTLARSPGGLREAYAQMLKSGIAKDSVLARIKEENKLRVGYSQTVPWFQRDPKTGQLSGIYHDVMEELARQLEIKIEYQESSWVNATVGLRKGDFDVFGSSLFYTIPRALVVSYVGPMWSKGRLVLTRKDEASRFKTVADLDNPDVTFSVNVGSAEENWVKVTFPKAKVITTSGQIALSAEPVRTGKADAWASGEEDVMVFAAKNPWAHIIDREHPTDRNPNTWAIRYGDPDWKAFLDMWSQKMVVSDFVKERRQFYLDRVAKSG